MPHLVESFSNLAYGDAIDRLERAHAFLVMRGAKAIRDSEVNASQWGIQLKRACVILDGDPGDPVPELIGKREERLIEVINMVATIERLLDAIKWFSTQPETDGCSVHECHPSTSGEIGSNDLVIADSQGRIVARCEVCDVASSNAGSNNKERKDLLSLECNTFVPQDGVARYICTARKFAEALDGKLRKWATKHYQNKRIKISGARESYLLLILPSENPVERK